MCRGVAWRGRAGQAFELGEPGVAGGTTANSLAADCRGPRQDDQAVKTKPLTRSCLRVLDQSLGPTRACPSRSRPLEQPCTMRLGCARADWASRSLIYSFTHVASHTRSERLRAVFGHALDESECSVWSNCFPRIKRARYVVHQRIERDPGHSAVPARDGRPFSRSPNLVIDTKGRAFRRLATRYRTTSRPRLVVEPRAQLHGCATRFLTLRSSA